MWKTKLKTKKETQSLEIEIQDNLIHVASVGFLVSWNQANMCQVHRKQSSVSMLAMNWSWLPPPCLHDITMKVGKRKYNCMWSGIDSQGAWLSVYRGENEEKKGGVKLPMCLHSPGKHEVKNVREAVIPIWFKKKNLQNVLMKNILWFKLQGKILIPSVCVLYSRAIEKCMVTGKGGRVFPFPELLI